MTGFGTAFIRLTDGSINTVPAMPRSPRDNEEIRAARREAIIEAATRVFATKGVANAKVKDIAEAAQLSHGLLYHYFESKEAVFEALVDEMIRRVDASFDIHESRPLERLRRVIVGRRQMLESDEVDATRVVMQAIVQGQALSDGLKARLEEHLLGVTARVRGWIEEAQQAGEILAHVSAEDLTNLLLYLFRGMAIRWNPIPVPLPRVETILGLLRACSCNDVTSANDGRLTKDCEA